METSRLIPRLSLNETSNINNFHPATQRMPKMDMLATQKNIINLAHLQIPPHEVLDRPGWRPSAATGTRRSRNCIPIVPLRLSRSNSPLPCPEPSPLLEQVCPLCWSRCAQHRCRKRRRDLATSKTACCFTSFCTGA